MNRTLLRVTLAAFLAGLLLALWWCCPSLQALESDLRQLRNRLGLWGLVLIAVAFTPCCLVLIPGSLLILLAGYFYGLLPAFVAVSLGSTIAAGVIFLFGRFVARGWIEARFGHDLRFQALDQAVAEQGFRIVLLTRLSPLFPFIFLNYAFSLTRVRFRCYLLATWLGMLPAIALWGYLGSTVQDFTQLLRGPLPDQQNRGAQGWYTGLTVLGLLATLAVTVLLARLARLALRRALLAAERPAPRLEPLLPS